MHRRTYNAMRMLRRDRVGFEMLFIPRPHMSARALRRQRTCPILKHKLQTLSLVLVPRCDIVLPYLEVLAQILDKQHIY